MQASNIVRRHLGKIVLLTLLAGGLSWLVPAIFAAREAARRSHCKNNLKQIGLALHNYHDVYGCYPPAITYGPDGKPWHSWRVLIMPFVESSRFYTEYSFDEPWNGPNNQRLMSKYAKNGRRFSAYHCPTDIDAPPDHASYFAVIGEGTMWPPHGVASLKDVTDGISKTANVVEVSDSGVHWMQPVDLRFDAMSFNVSPSKGVGIRSHHGGTKQWFSADERGGANVGTADGWVQFLGSRTPPPTVKSLLTIDDGKPVPVEGWKE